MQHMTPDQKVRWNLLNLQRHKHDLRRRKLLADRAAKARIKPVTLFQVAPGSDTDFLKGLETEQIVNESSSNPEQIVNNPGPTMEV